MAVTASKDSSPQQPPWHVQTGEAVAKLLSVDSWIGLTPEAAATRLLAHGHNEIEEGARRTVFRMLLGQFADVMILILLAAALVSGIIGEPHDAIAILVIVFLNAVIGVVQEYRAERAIAALKELAAPEAHVRRGGHVQTIAARDLVPGDVVVLEAGNVVPADLRLIEDTRLQVDESALTGESHAVDKLTEPLDESSLPIGDRRNMAYKGTMVTRGHAVGLVVATGMHTELGQIASMLQREEAAQTPLQQRLARFGRRLAVAILAVCVIILVAGLLRGEPMVLMVLTAVSLAVAAIPEALPAVVTISLALGARKMSEHDALVRRLPAVETLGSVTYICADKTGTLTQNQMRMEALYADGGRRTSLPPAGGGEELWNLLGQSLALSNDAVIDPEGGLSGDPTEVALCLGALEAGFDKPALAEALPRVAEIPFDAERRCMTTLHQSDQEVLVFSKGAPEKILAHCRETLTSAGLVPIDRDALLDEAERLAAEGYRVLALAYDRLPSLPAQVAAEHLERDLAFLAFAGLIDPPREEVPDAVAECRTAGITPVMITGDHPGTAHAIAHRLGLVSADDDVLTGRDLENMALTEFETRVSEIRVYARVDPEQKIKIVRALQDRGEFAAMTGDGVNDAPALKRADIGVAMGLKGTDVAREASDMVLLDDNFATIVTAVREGRRIYDNIRKFVRYTMTSNSGEVLTLFLAPFLGLPLPLLPLQILWINLVTDGLPGLALAAEQQERGVMQRPPRPPQENIFAHGVVPHILIIGLLIAGLSLSAQAWYLAAGSDHWQTMVFTVLTFCQLAHVMVIRSERDSLFTIGIFSNPMVVGAVLITIGLQLMIIYVPFFQPIFKTHPLTMDELGVCFTLPLFVFAAVELEKWLVRRGVLYRTNNVIAPRA